MPQLIESYENSGKFKFVMREYPIVKPHPRVIAVDQSLARVMV